MDRPKRSSQSLYDYHPAQGHSEDPVEQSSTPSCLTYDEIFKKVSFALAESISSSPKVSEPDPYLRDYLRSSDLRRRASLSVSSAPSPLVRQRSSSRPRVHFSPEPISPDYIPLQSTGSNIDAVDRSRLNNSPEESKSRTTKPRHNSTPAPSTQQLPPQRSRTNHSPNPLLPPPPSGSKPRLINFPRPNRRRLSIERLATETKLPDSPPPQAIELPPSPPPEFDFSEFEECVHRQGYNLLDNLPVDTQAPQVELDMTRPLIDLDGPTESPDPRSTYACPSSTSQKNTFAPFSPLPLHDIYESLSLQKNAFGDFSPLPSPTTYEPPPEFVSALLESPVSDLFSSPGRPYQTRSTRERQRSEEKEAVVAAPSSDKANLKSPTTENGDKAKSAGSSDDDQKSGSTLRDQKTKTSPNSTKAGVSSGGYSLFGLKSPIQLSQIIPAVASLWASTSSNAAKLDSHVDSEKDEPVETPINSRAPTPSNNSVGAYTFSPAIELLSPPTRTATPCNAPSPSVLPPPPRTRSPSVATCHARSQSAAPSPAPVEAGRPRSATGSCCPACEQRPTSAQSWTSYPARPPSTQPDFSSRASRLSDLVTTVRRKAIERADELDQMLATAIAREREFDELLDQMRERDRQRSKDFNHLLVNWAARVPLPADDSHAPTPFIHHTFTSNPDQAKSPAPAQADQPSSRLPTAPSVNQSATGRSHFSRVDDPVHSPREHTPVRSPTAPSIVQSVSARSAAASCRHHSVHSPSISHTPASVNINLPSASPVMPGSFQLEEPVRSPAAASIRSVKAVSVCSPKPASVRSPTVASIRSQKAASVFSGAVHSPAQPVSVHSAGVESGASLPVRSRRASATGSLGCPPVAASIRDDASSVGRGKEGDRPEVRDGGVSDAGHEGKYAESARGDGGSNGGGSIRGGAGGASVGRGDDGRESLRAEANQKEESGEGSVAQPDQNAEVGGNQEEEARADATSVAGSQKHEQPPADVEPEKVKTPRESVVAASVTVSRPRSVMSAREASIKSGGDGGGSMGGGGGDTASLAPSSASSSEDTGPAICSILPTASNKPGKWLRQGPAGFKFVEI